MRKLYIGLCIVGTMNNLRTMMKSFLFIFSLVYFNTVNAQLTTDNLKLWEKNNEVNSRENTKCNIDKLLNFNCNLEEKIDYDEIKYPKDKPHSIIYVHSSQEEEKLWSNKENEIDLTNSGLLKLKNKDVIKLKKKPSIFSYASPKIDYKEKVEDSIHLKINDANVYELVFAEQKIPTSKLKRYHTYLAIKYGISLEKSKYYNSKNDVIWDPGKHDQFKHRPTGIGRDDANALYQRQSSNQEDLFLTIAKKEITTTNNENSAALEDKSFVIWSDDDGEMQFEKDGDFDVLKRNWEINFIGAVSKSDFVIRIDKATINPESKETNYWLLIKNADGDVDKIQGTEDEKEITFSNVSFDHADPKQTTFTFALNRNERSEENMSDNEIKDPLLNTHSEYDEIFLYPNPVKSDQVFTVAFPPMENLVINVHDSGGRMISSEKVSPHETKYHKKVTTQGIYLINLIKDGTVIKTFKLIVN